MDIYYKENTGIKTAQEENCDYFTIENLGADLRNGKGYAVLHFWERVEHAQTDKPANASRNIVWDLGQDVSITAGYQKVLGFESIQTESGDMISLNNATIVE